MKVPVAITCSLALLGPVLTAAAPTEQMVLAPAPGATSKKSPRPLVIWHGLGDTGHSEGIDSWIDYIKEKYLGIFVHSVVVPEGGSPSDESRAGWWGVAAQQGQEGCDQISGIEELENGFDAVGFSQGGLFLRYYAQYCPGPPIKNLITFGTPHFGIAALIPCPEPPTLACQLAAGAAKAGIYTDWAQSHLVQAQYYRDPARMDEFLQHNRFIRDLNAEGSEPEKEKAFWAGGFVGRERGGAGLGELENIVAVAFDEDQTVFPALSAHWTSQDPANATVLVPLRDQKLYKEDTIGLRSLDERGRLHLVDCPGRHMELGGKGGCGDRMLDKWVGWRE